MKALNYADLIARFEDQAQTPDSELPPCSCDMCRSDEHSRPCMLSDGGWCESGQHFWKRDTPYGYSVDVIFEACPRVAAAKLAKIHEEIRAREQADAKSLLAHKASELRIVRMADDMGDS